MVFIVRDKPGVIRPDTSGKVIPAEDFWAWCDARETVQDAVRRHDEILARARAAFIAEQQRGYQEGSERARVEQSKRMMELVSNTVNYFARVEGKMVDVVLTAVRQIVSGFDDRERVLEAVRNCLNLVRSQTQLRLRVHPTQLDLVRDQLGKLLQAHPEMRQVDVTGDPTLARDACAAESELGTVEAGVTAQLEALRTTLQKVFPNPQLPGAAAVPRIQGEDDGDLVKELTRRNMV